MEAPKRAKAAKQTATVDKPLIAIILGYYVVATVL
jgi:hypothetical protein